jgi:hypothetical protein
MYGTRLWHCQEAAMLTFFLAIGEHGNPKPLVKFAKISIFKVDNFVLPIFLLPKLRSVAQIEWKKHPYYFFLLLVQK